MRTVGQAFDVCHKANPKPQFKRPEKASESDEKPPNEANVDDAVEKVSGENDTTPASPSNTDIDAATAVTTKREEQEADQVDNNNDLMQFNPDEYKIPNGTSDTNLDPLFSSANPQSVPRPDHREVYLGLSALNIILNCKILHNYYLTFSIYSL